MEGKGLRDKVNINNYIYLHNKLKIIYKFMKNYLRLLKKLNII